VECYQARSAESGNSDQESKSCPLAEPDSSVAVISTQDGFAVSIQSSNIETATRIFDVSEQLAPSNTRKWSALVRHM
jgi:hypothetical protein